MTRTRAALATLALTALATLTACSSEPTYDADQIADKVVSEQKKITPDLEVTDGTCEEDVPLEVDEVIGCTVDIDGVEARYDVTITAVEDDQARYSFEPAEAIISVQAVVDLIQGQLAKEDLHGVDVDCGDTAVRVEEPGSTFTCELSLDGQTQEATVTVNDASGNVRVDF